MAQNNQPWDAGGSKEVIPEECSQKEAKFRQMQEYIPFLETMIGKLERTQDKSREAQLLKMKSLHAVLTNSKKKLKIETLVKCEEVLKKLKEKVDKVPSIQENPSVGTKQGNGAVGGELTNSVSTRDKSEAVVSSTTPQPSSYVVPLKKAVARVSDDSPSRMSPIPTVTSSQSDNCVSSTETRLPEDILAQSREKLTKIIDISSDNSSDIEWIYDRRKDVLSGKEKALKNASVSKLLSYDIASAIDWVRETDKTSVNKSTPLSQSLSISYNIPKYGDRASKSAHELQPSKHFWDSHNENKLSPVEEPRDAPPCTEERRSNSSSAYTYEGHSLLSEDDNTTSKKDEVVTSRSLRAKLEEEIHKVHRVGVSTGGALRALINKDDRKNSPVKNKPEKLNIDTVSPVRTSSEKVEKVSPCLKIPDHSTAEEKLPLFSRSPSRLDKWKGSSDPRKRQSIEQAGVANTPDSDAVKQVEPKSNENSDPRLKQGSGYGARNFQTVQQSNQSDNKGKSHSLLSSLSSEDLQRIVTENLQSLPSPPPNTKEILENVKAASPMTANRENSVNVTHANICSPAHTPETSQITYTAAFRIQGASFGQKQMSAGSGTYAYENSLEQSNSANRPALLPTPGLLQKPGIPPAIVCTQSHPDVVFGVARQRDVDGLKSIQHGHQGNVVDPRLNVHRSGVVEQRVSKDPRLNATDYSQSSPGEQWPGSPCYGILSRPMSEVSVVEYSRESGPVHHSARQVDHRSRERCAAPVQQLSSHVSSAHMWPNQQQAVMQHQPYGGRSDPSYLQQHAHQSQMGHPTANASQNMSPSFYASRGYRPAVETSPSLLGPGPIMGRRGPILSERDPRRRSIEDSDAARSSRPIERRPRTPDPRRSGSRDRRSRSRDRRRDASRDRRRDMSRDRRRDASSDRWRDGSSDRKREGTDRRHSDNSDRRRDERHSENKSDRDSQSGKSGAKEIISPLNSLYEDSSVPKTGKGYGFQHFRIPKIKRDPPHVHRPRSPVPVTKTEEEKSSVRTKVDETRADDKPVKHTAVDQTESTEKEATENSAKAESVDNTETCSKKTEELTQELIESFIRRSFECGEGKKLLDNAIFLENLNEKLKAKKLQKIKRILESDSDSDSDNSGKNKKSTKAKQIKKKESDDEAEKADDDDDDDEVVKEDKKKTRRRRVIVSDDSDDDNGDMGDNKTTMKQSEKVEVNEEDTEDEKPLAELSKSKNSEEEKRKPKSAMISPKAKAKNKKKVTIDIKESAKTSDKQHIEEQKSSENESGCDGKSMEKKGRGVKQMKKHRRRSPLELLQEDIREMFISEGVVTATGYRMCRLLKEVKPGMSIEEVSKSEARRMQEEAEMECEHFTKTRKQRGRRKTITDFSDDGYDEEEEDDDYEYNSKELKTKPGRKKKDDHQKHQSEQSKNSNSAENDEDLSQKFALTAKECRRLARSVWRWAGTQISSREAKEADDVSDRKSTASDKASDQSGYEYVETQDPFCFKRRFSKRKEKPQSIKIEDIIKKLTENVFGETCKEKDVAEPCVSSGATQGVGDVENEIIDDMNSKDKNLLETHETGQSANKKPVTPRKFKKKKASAWQLGIIKKKSAHKCKFDRPDLIKSPASCSVDDSDLETKLGDDPVADKEESDTTKKEFPDENSENKTAQENLSDISNEKSKTDSVQMKNKHLSDGIKPSDLEAVSRNDEENREPNIKLASSESKEDKSETKHIDSSQEAYNSHREYAIDKMYAFDGSPKYHCKLCSYFGRGITNHYKTQHPNSEVYISRLNLTEATNAIASSQKIESDNCAAQPSGDKSRKQSLFKCRMCDLTTNKVNTFYDHLTTHTGEYRYQCDVCQFISSSRTNFKSHFLTHHPGFDIKTNILHTINNTERIVFGHMCTACHFVQIEKKNVEKHIEMIHSDSDFSDSQLPKVLPINMSKHSVDVHDSDDDVGESSSNPTKEDNGECSKDKTDIEVSGEPCEIPPEDTKTNVTDDKCNKSTSEVLSHVLESEKGERMPIPEKDTNANANSEVSVNNEPKEIVAAMSNSDSIDTKNTEIIKSNKLPPGVDHKETCDEVPKEKFEEEIVSIKDNNSVRSRAASVEKPALVKSEALVETKVEIKPAFVTKVEIEPALVKGEALVDTKLEIKPAVVTTVEIKPAVVKGEALVATKVEIKGSDTNTATCEVPIVEEAPTVQDENTNKDPKESIKTSTSEIHNADKTTTSQNTTVSDYSARECTEVSKDEAPNLESIVSVNNETVSGSVPESNTDDGDSDSDGDNNTHGDDSTPSPVAVHEENDAKAKIPSNLKLTRTISNSEENATLKEQSNLNLIRAISNSEEKQKSSLVSVVEETEENRKRRISAFVPSDTADQHEEMLHNERYKTMEAITQSLKFKPVIKSSIDVLIESIDIRKKQEESTNTGSEPESVSEKSSAQSKGDVTKSNSEGDESTLIDERRALEAAQAVKCSDAGASESSRVLAPKSKDDPYSEQEILDDDVIKHSDSSLFDKIFSPALNKIQKKELKKPSTVKTGVTSTTYASSPTEGNAVEIELLSEDKIRNLSESSLEGDHESSLPLIVQRLAKHIADPSALVIGDDENDIDSDDGVSEMREFEDAAVMSQNENTADSSDADSVNYDELYDAAAAYEKRIMGLSGPNISDSGLPLSVKKCKYSYKRTSPIKLDSGNVTSVKQNSSKTVCSPPPAIAIRKDKKIFSANTFGTPDIRVGSFSARLYGSSKVLFSCLIQGCIFQSTQVSSFSEHLKINHKSSYWDGFCQTCKFNIKGEGTRSSHVAHIVAFNHLLDEHVLTDRCFLNDSAGKETPLVAKQQHTGKSDGTVDSEICESDEVSSDLVENTVPLETGFLGNNMKEDGDKYSLSKENDNRARKSDSKTPTVEGSQATKASTVDQEKSLNSSAEGANESDTSESTDTADGNKPKIYLRTRRLSGDKLSGHKDGPEVQSSLCGENDCSSSDDVSFIKITTVVSLNPNAENSVGGIEDLDIIENDSTLDEENADTSSSGVGDVSPQTQESLPTDSVAQKEPQVLNAVLLTPGIAVSSAQPPRMQLMKLTTASDVAVASQLRQTGAVQLQQPIVWTGTAGTALTPARVVRIAPKGSPAVTKANVFGISLPQCQLSQGSKEVLHVPSLFSSRGNESQSPVHQIVPKTRTENRSPNLQAGKSSPSKPNSTNNETSPTNEWLPSHKSSKAFQRMLETHSLRNLYKCMDKSCYWTENVGGNFLHHLRMEHYRKKTSDWNRCSYCPFRGDGSPLDLVKHITKKHGHCQYQCAYCFFRGMACSYVVLHQNTGHINRPVKVLLCTNLKVNPPAESELVPLEAVVLPYICDQGSCGEKFYNPKDFLLHLQWQHNQVSTLTCHICKSPSLKAARLVSHYKFHSLSLYQCRHCPHGAETEEEIQQHLCNTHHNLPALAVLRHYEPTKQSARGGDVNRLKIVNLDQTVSGDIISRPDSPPVPGGTSIQSEMCAEEVAADANQAGQIVFSQMTESEIIDAVQNASFEILENQVTEASQESATSSVPENASLPKTAPLPLPKVTSSLQETNIKGEVSDSSPSKNQDAENNDDDDGNGCVDEDDDVQVLYYQLATKGKQCHRVACKDSCKLRQPQPGKESPVKKLKNSMTELIKETDSQNSSDSVILLTKSCPEVTTKASGLTQEHPTREAFLVSTPKKFSTKVSIRNADSGSNIDSESETNSCAESVNTAYGADKSRTVQASEGPNVSEDSVTQGDQRKQSAASGLMGEDLYLCGNARCEYRAATASQLREHLCVCDLSREGVLRCPHCSRPFKAFNTFVDHLRIHGVPRYSCALCTYRHTTPTAVAKHLKILHKVSCTETVPVDRFLNNHETDMFIVCPKGKGRPKRNPTGRVVKTVYRPEEIHLLPMSAILKDPIECSVCSFKTKVRSNMKRHLGLHLDPDVDPADIPTVEVVNPVPCLERNEKMFDKMTNLAASSNIGVQKPTSSATSSVSASAVTAGAANDEGPLQQQQYMVPQYVEEHRRYVCSSAGCSYLTCSEAMLRHHLRALHLDEVVYRCPHCPSSAPEVPLERLGAHLRMHGDRLYGCAHCPYFHFQRHIVERHLVDRHPEKRAFVVVIRESEAAQAQASTDLTSSGTADALLSPTHAVWVCGLCDCQCPSRGEVLDHVLAVHGIKSQFKCSHCSFRTSSRLSFEPHFVSRHPGEKPYMMDVYRRVEVGGGGAASAAVSAEPSFDTRPLWSRNSAGVRHIRGILIEEESQIKENITDISDNAKKVLLPPKKESADTALQRTPTSGSTQIKKEVKSEIKQETQEDTIKKQLEDDDKELVGAFGPYGKPAAGNLFVCTLCERYKTKFRGDMRDHLYRELNYSKWVCTHCRLMSCSRSHLQKHSAKVHDKNHKPEAIASLPPDKEIEEWVEKVLTTQYSLMKQHVTESQSSQTQKKTLSVGIKRSHSETQLQEVNTGAIGSPSNSGKEEQDAASATASQPTKRAAALLARALSQTSMLELSEPLPSGSPLSSRKGSDIEEPVLEKKQAFTASPEHKKKPAAKEPKIPCMDCGAMFINVRGLKLHIRMNHMCTAKWLCGYCHQGGTTELAIKQHCRTRHRGMPELVKYNEEGASLKLDDEFWEINYGLSPKPTTTASSPSTTARQPESLLEECDSHTELPELLSAEEARRCSHCSYSCRSPSDLRKHEMRHWVQKPYKCGYCSFEAIREYEVRKHSEKVHPQQSVNIKQKEVPLRPDIKPLRIKRHHTGTVVSGSNAECEIEDNEEQTPQVSSNAECESDTSPSMASEESVSDVSSMQKKTKIFRCFYCPRRATSLAVIHEHWQKTHKTKAVCANGVTRLGLPFSYKEMAVDDVLKGSKKLHMNRTAFVCVYCKRKGSRSTLLKHHEEHHPNKEFSIVEATAHHYECSECSFVALALHVLRRHFETEHRDSDFRYIVKPSKQPGDEGDNVVVRTETVAVKRPGTSSTLSDAGNYVCMLCNTRTDSEDQFHSDHHSVHHPNVEPKYCFESVGHEAKRTKFECPRCCFISDNYEILKEHLERHVKPFKCGYCAQQYDLESKVVRHSQFSHVDCGVRVIHVRESEVENLKKLVIQRNVADDETLCPNVPVSEKKSSQSTPSRIRNVARKSTALSSVSARQLIKSLSANRSEEDSAESSESDDSSTESPYSYYGRSPSPIDENRLLAFANYGGSVIRMSLSTFSKLYNIYPKVKVRDLKHEKLAPI